MIDIDGSVGTAACNICGGTSFEPGPSGRMAHEDRPPRCSECRSLERHRALRHIYDAIPDRFLEVSNCLQFAKDPAVPRDRFGSFELSVFGEDNHLNMMNIDRDAASYSWVIANHVVEHLPNDLAGVSELMRIAGPNGIVQITVPAPKARIETDVLDAPDEVKTFHFHTYGSNFPDLMKPALGKAAGIQVVSRDETTVTWDVAYFFSANHGRLFDLGQTLIDSQFPVMRCV